MQRRRAEIEELWNGCLRLAESHDLPERCAAALTDASYDLRIRRGSYQASAMMAVGEAISEQTASRDLKAMVDLGLLEPVGERRARYYLAGERPKKLRNAIRAKRPPEETDDPFHIVRERRQLSLKT
jgi:hypothetical protein